MHGGGWEFEPPHLHWLAPLLIANVVDVRESVGLLGSLIQGLQRDLAVRLGTLKTEQDDSSKVGFAGNQLVFGVSLEGSACG